MNAVKRSAVTKVAAGVSVAALLLLTGCDVPGVYRPPRPATGGPYVFYVSPDGDDGNDGLSPEKPWRTLDHANSVRFQPGDRLRLKGGARFRGSVTLDKGEAGSPAQPVVIESYGKGRATIAPRGSSGITVRNTAGVEVRNVSLVGDAKALREGVGIAFRNSLPGGRRLDHIRITDVEARGFQNGISIGAEKGATAGYGDVRISETRLVERRSAFREDRDPFGVDVDTEDVVPDVGHARGVHSSEVSRTDDGQPHALFSCVGGGGAKERAGQGA